MYSSNARATAHNYDVIRNGTETEEKKDIMFKSMSELREKNKEIGHCFFDRDTMKFWGSRIESALYRGTYFITSEKGNTAQEKRKYSIRRALKTGEIVTEGKLRAYSTLDDAKEAVRDLIRAMK
jgi:hypothetical protein